MVNEIVLEYLKEYYGKYKIEDLKKKILSAGYSEKEIEGALEALNLQLESEEVEKPIEKPIEPLVERIFPTKISSSPKWLSMGGIFGIIMLTSIFINIVLGMIIKTTLSSPFSFVFSLLFSLSSILFFYGFFIFGKKYNNKLVKITSLSFIIFAVLFVILLILLILFPEIIVKLFFSSLKDVTTLDNLNFTTIYSQLFTGLVKIFVVLILIFLILAALNIVFGIGLLRLKEVEKSKIAGILHIVGGALLIIFIGIFVLVAAFIFDVILLFKESKKNERR